MHRIAVFVALCVVVVVSSAQAGHVVLSAQEEAYIQANPTIRVSNESSWPPFNFNEEDKAKGYSVDYIQLVAEKLGLQVEFVNGPSWSEFLAMMDSRELDVMLNIVNSAERREYINFTNPYVISTPAIYANDPQGRITSLGSLKGKSVAVPRGFFSHELLARKYPEIKLHLTRDVVEAMQAVFDGQADAFISDTGVADFLITKHHLHGLKIAAMISDPMFVNVMSIGVRKDRPILRAILQKGMDSISDDEIQRMREKWLGLAKGNRIQAPLGLSDQELEYLSHLDEITMCIDPDWLPYEKFDEDGKHIGMSAEYFDAFSLRLGKPIRAVVTKTWPESLETARERGCDILSLAMVTPERLKYLNFTKPYVISPMVIATQPNATFIPDIPSIGEHAVGIVKGYAYVSVFRSKYPDIRVVEVDTLNTGLDLVRDGQLFGMVGTLTTIGYAIQENYIGELKISGKFDDTLDMSIGVRNDSPELLSIFNKLINAITPAQHRAISQNWVAVHYKEVPNYTLILAVVVVFTMIAAFLIYRQVQLRRYNTELEHLSTTDRLTGLFNRLKLDEMLELRHAELERFDRHFSVIMLDIDHFKPVNDKFGHQVGDKVLIKVGEVIKQHARGVDSVGRWGGEEFLIVCPETHATGAVVQSEHIREVMKKTDFALGRPVTVSVGVAEARLGEGVKDIIARADKALYAAKEGGRDQVKVAEAD